MSLEDMHETDHGVEVVTSTLVSWSNMAEAVAQADSHGQAEFFEHLAICLDGVTMGAGRWAMQCRAIAEDSAWLPLNRTRLAGQLETLAEHMREDVEAA